MPRRKALAAGCYGGPPIHPGAILREDFMLPFSLSANALAMALHVPQSRLGEIVAGRRLVTADTALRLARHFGTTPAFWLNLQATHDLRVAEIEHGREIAAEVEEREPALV